MVKWLDLVLRSPIDSLGDLPPGLAYRPRGAARQLPEHPNVLFLLCAPRQPLANSLQPLPVLNQTVRVLRHLIKKLRQRLRVTGVEKHALIRTKVMFDGYISHRDGRYAQTAVLD